MSSSCWENIIILQACERLCTFTHTGAHSGGNLAVLFRRAGLIRDISRRDDEEMRNLRYNFNFPHVPFGTDPQ
jgi:hypothetical protein